MPCGRRQRRLLAAAATLLAAGAALWGALHLPSVYFRTAIFRIRGHSIMRDRVDWAALRAEGLRRIGPGWGPAAATPAIRYVLANLGDHHSFFIPAARVGDVQRGALVTVGLTAVWPERVVALVLPGSAAAEAGVAVGEVVQAVNGQPARAGGGYVFLPTDGQPMTVLLARPGGDARTVTLRPRLSETNRPLAVRRLEGAIAAVEVPTVMGTGAGFDRQAWHALAAADVEPVCGWVVDLRRNGGGSMWPMLSALRPILGEGTPGYFVGPGGRVPWVLPDAAGPGDGAARPVLKREAPPVAVLTSRLTASSGEAVAIAFRGRKATRSFGEPTAGLSSSNATLRMVDGALLVVTNAAEADRTGRVYEGRVEPDQALPVDWAHIESADDPVLRAAVAWLNAQPGCE
jgi:carboxyl-terminal processing protease